MQNKNEFSRQPRFLPEMPTGEVDIISPPTMAQKPEISWFVIMLPPAVMLIITVLIALTSKSAYMFIAIATTVMTIITSVVAATSQINKYKKSKVERESRYLQYITDLRADLALKRNSQITAMNEMNPDPLVCINRIYTMDSKLWERTPAHNDFLSIRMGIGNVPFAIDLKYEKKQSIMEDDPLIGEPLKIALEFEKVNNVPVCLDLFHSEICGFAGEDDKITELLEIAMLQIVTNHGYDDVRIVFLLKEINLLKWDWVKFLPHIWDDDYKSRFMLCGKTIAHQTLSELFEVLKARELNNDKETKTVTNVFPHYIFIVDEVLLLENEGISKYLFNPSKDLGVSTIFTAKNKAYLPMNCKMVINIGAKVCESHNKETGQKISFNPDRIDLRELERIGRKLAPLKIRSADVSFALPKSITLSQMYHIKKVEEIDILTKWQTNRTFKGMSVPIGARAGGELFHLDMHETGFGPHGLVAGTTGSGKSELLQSIIISIAINYHPHDVVFVLIDYKGGGMADAFRGMPHLVGTITNLGGNQTTRALISIKSELQRRQRIFSEHNVNNIDKYQKLYHNGGAEIPVPHLIMIADEFAELKAEQPDFMKELVSAARVGRSLGVHLILATQKPAGVVDDQIWSNSKFKICLKVQDATDSKDVIKRPDAAMIKEPGRAYIQVGNDEVFEMFQSAFAGADYDPDGEKQKNENKSKNIYKVSINGKCEKIYPMDEEKISKSDIPSQLKSMVDYITVVAKENNIEALDGPWLAPLSNELFLDDILDFDIGFDYENGQWKGKKALLPTVGIIDNPRAQLQVPISFDFINDGNLFIYGMSGSGKTVFLQTLCMSIAHSHTPQEASIYVMDFGGTAFKQLELLPHIGGVMTMNDEDKINQFMLFIFRIIEERKEEFLNARVDNFSSYKEKSINEMPAILIMIDNYFALSESYEIIDEQMMLIAREGTKFGVFIVATATNATLVRYRFSINFKMAVAFGLTEKSEYDSIVGRCEGLEPTNNPGRALLRNKPPLEFQTATPYFKERSIEDILNVFKGFVKQGKIRRATPIPLMPSTIDIFEINSKNIDSTINIGLMDKNLQPATLDIGVNHTVLITGDIGTGKSSVLLSVSNMLLSRNNVKIYAKDSNSMAIYPLLLKSNVVNLDEIENEAVFISKIIALLENRRKEINIAKKSGANIDEIMNSWEQILFVFDNLVEFSEIGSLEMKDLIERIVKKEFGMKVAIIAASNISDISSCYDGFVKTIKDAQCGIIFGSLKEQNLFNVRLPYGTYEKEFDILDGYFINKNKFFSMKTAIDKGIL